MKLAKHSSPAGLSWLWPLFIFIAALPVLSHWVRAAAFDPDPLPGGSLAAMSGGTCSVSGPGSCATGNCPKPPLWEVETVTATAAKCGYLEFTGQNLLPSNVTLISTNGTNAYVINGPPVFYLTYRKQHSVNGMEFIAHAAPYTGWFGGGGYYSDYSTATQVGAYASTHVWDPTNCMELSVNQSGNYSEFMLVNLVEHWYYITDPPYITNVPPYAWTNYDYNTSITNAVTGQWDCYEGVYGEPGWGPGTSTVSNRRTHLGG